MSDTSHIDALLSEIESHWCGVGGQTFEHMVDQNEQLQMDFGPGPVTDIVSFLTGLGFNVLGVVSLDDLGDEYTDDSALD